MCYLFYFLLKLILKMCNRLFFVAIVSFYKSLGLCLTHIKCSNLGGKENDITYFVCSFIRMSAISVL